MINLYGFTLEEMQDFLTTNNFKKFNAAQLFDWLYLKKARSFQAMSNLSKELRTFLEAACAIDLLKVQQHQHSDDGTHKFLFELFDGYAIEAVLMTHDYGLSLCVSSQVGCNMGCSFCASGLKKKNRNLTSAEMVSQVMTAEDAMDVKITHLVVMGTGEPFDNYDNVIRFVKIVNDSKGLAIGQRHITISTCGIVPMIIAYANEPIRSNLAVSLHAPNDELRNLLMPINKRYPLKEIIAACETYFEKTSRRITFEYLLLSGVNDTLTHADQLSDLIRGLNAYVNLIPYNHVSEFQYEQTDMVKAMQFYDRLTKRGITATLRKEQGSDIDAACGQLRLKSDQK
ncbi:MAG: 23S rRNA (adenine(2503)-C(2))-methyltransferase RlmN [Candidatus Izemoplasmatales bacterium]